MSFHDSAQTDRRRWYPEPEFIVEPDLSGMRVDSFLSRHLRNYTAWRLHRLVAAGLVRIDERPAERQQRVYRGQTVRVRLVDPPDRLTESAGRMVPVVYEDPWLMVVDKPAGMVVHPTGRFQSGTLTGVLQRYLDEQTGCRGLMRAGIVHRLDRLTSGLLVVTREYRAHRTLSEDFQDGRLKKSYIALVEGRVPFQERLLDRPIGRHPGGRSVLMSAHPQAIHARPARTHVKVVRRLKTMTVVECRPETGRNHQIRVHLADIGHPVAGDAFYGPGGTIRDARGGPDPVSIGRHALHAARLEFQHPILKIPVRVSSPVPESFWEAAG